MEQEDVVISITRLSEEVKSLKHRMDEVEEMTQSINKLAISVEKLATNINEMIKKQEKYETRLKDQGQRIGELEKADAEKWKHLTKTVLAAIVTGIVGFCLAKIGF